MIENDQEFQITLERIAYFQKQIQRLRQVETNPENYRLSVSGYMAELDRMNLEVRDYLWLLPRDIWSTESSQKVSGHCDNDLIKIS